MDVYVARQAIFDIDKKVVAYELLFRNSNINEFIIRENSNPTLDVIRNSFSVIGLDKITGGKRAFINFDEELIKSRLIEAFPKDCIAVEILETVKPDFRIIECCRSLKEKGYMIALDDFEYTEEFDAFLTGMFSLMDALMNIPIENVLNDLPVSNDVKDALLGKENLLSDLLKLIIEYEKGNWEEVNGLIDKFELDEGFVRECYLDAIQSLRNLEDM